MSTKVAVAGATGNLGLRIVRALAKTDALIIALARTGTAEEKLTALRTAGAQVEAVDFGNKEETASMLDGVRCVVSTLQGLADVILQTQSRLLEAVVEASVPRFIPSDFATDFRQLPAGENRNFDLRRKFHETLDPAPVRATSIFNGAFAEILAYGTPLLDLKEKSVGYWEDAEWRIDFTTMDDTAAYTAAVAMDESTPPALHISSFSVSPQDIAATAEKVLGTSFTLKRMGSLEDLRSQNKRERAAHPEGERDLYASWQQGQYLQSMFSTHHPKSDNDRYPGLSWTSLEQVLTGVFNRKTQQESA
ncbi:MAG: NmrA family NAD(P)-binding protein [Acidobacteriaceae bacterium]|nr:NmrA family NAD(P)-binding protein [Acidobacteriaceae bacterium]